jgi:predicted nuclease of restriction endonuclease-like (RecB) superfamily
MMDVKELVLQNVGLVDENRLFERVASIIERRKLNAATYANREITLMYWEVGRFVNSVVLDCKRADYGKKILTTLSSKLVGIYGNSFSEANLYRMIKFAEVYDDFAMIEEWACFLSWSHFCEIMRVKKPEARAFYAKDAAERRLGIKALRQQISRKAYERTEIANAELIAGYLPFNVFKDPYLLDVLGLKENFLEADLEKAILSELENFILEFGHGFSFIERQKRMTMDGDDFHLDLLFYHRGLRRLVAIELKLGKFKPLYKGQMEFYLRWLDKYERKDGENAPIGLILCTEASRDQIELMEMDRAGIAVAEYWTDLPPKAEFERKIKEIYHEAQERLERRKMLTIGGGIKSIDYLIESDKDDGDGDD